MAANELTKIQINFKWEKDGDMINIYATDEADAAAQLQGLQNIIPIVAQTSQMLRGVAQVNRPSVPVPTEATATVTPIKPAATAVSGVAPACAHGNMNWREWDDRDNPGTRKGGYLCAAPKDFTGRKCKAVGVKNV